MTADKTEFARRAVACKGWRWMPGMVTRGGNRALEDDPAEVWEPVEPMHYSDLGLPDLDDPATLGCLLALVREAWGDPMLTACEAWVHERATGKWEIDSYDMRCPDTRHDSEAEALVAALEAAP